MREDEATLFGASPFPASPQALPGVCTFRDPEPQLMGEFRGMRGQWKNCKVPEALGVFLTSPLSGIAE